MRTFYAIFAVAASLAIGGTTAAQADGAQISIGVTGFVPIKCHATLDTQMVTVNGSQTTLGLLREACNDAKGYEVFVDSSPELANAQLVVDGQTLTLTGSGSTLVSTSAVAGVAARQLSLKLPANSTGGTLSFRISPR